MKNHWESLGILGPVYRGLGRGLSDREMATDLHVSETSVASCVDWLLRFLKLTNRRGLMRRAHRARVIKTLINRAA
jgi:DNA-binding NarL/FixJ family response regulator